ncbi:MAG: glycosyltransferase family 9 protein [Planctomycetales bacterium]|nr:glycosyltransferase family 9 protein [Planctomycetales bacterium]
MTKSSADKSISADGTTARRRHALPQPVRQTDAPRYRYTRRRWRMLFTVIDLVGGWLVGAVRWASRRRGDRGEAAPHDDPRRILLVQLDHLGDAVITTVMLPLLRRRYPAATIEVLAGFWNAEIFDASAEVDRVHVSHVNRFARNRRLGWIAATFLWGWRLRQRRYDLAIDVRGEFPHALILWLCGARRRVGWRSGGGGFLLTDSPAYVPNRPEVESRLALLEVIGIVPETGESVVPRVVPRRPAKQRVRRQLTTTLSADSGGARGPLCVLHVGAGMAAKHWPAQHWRELIGRLVVDHDARVVIVGDDNDRAIARRILDERSWPSVFDWTGQLRIEELAALAQQADVFVGADSGPAHLAAAVGAPVVVLFSGTNNAEQWQPRGGPVRVVSHPVPCGPCHRTRCPLADHPCMTGLLPRAVVALLSGTLDDGARAPNRAASALKVLWPNDNESHPTTEMQR